MATFYFCYRPFLTVTLVQTCNIREAVCFVHTQWWLVLSTVGSQGYLIWMFSLKLQADPANGPSPARSWTRDASNSHALSTLLLHNPKTMQSTSTGFWTVHRVVQYSDLTGKRLLNSVPVFEVEFIFVCLLYILLTIMEEHLISQNALIPLNLLNGAKQH